MSVMLCNHRLLFTIAFAKRSFKSQSIMDLSDRMKSFNNSKQYQKTIQLFDQSKSNNKNDIQNSLYSRSVLFHVLKACAELRDRELGSNLHKIISTKFQNDSYLLASLIHLRMQCNDVERAESLFNSSTNKINGMYGSMMKGYITNKQPEKAVRLFKQIKQPDEFSYTLVVNACAKIGSNEQLNFITDILKDVPQTLYSNSMFVTSLLDAFGKCGDIKSAETLFNSSNVKDLGMQRAMMKAYIVNDQPNKAIDLFKDIKSRGVAVYSLLFNAYAKIGSNEQLNFIKDILKDVPQAFYSNSMFITSLLDAFGKCGDIKSAETLFNSSTEKNIEMYGAMMKGYIVDEQPNKAIDLFKTIKNPHVVAYTLLFNACAKIGSIEQLNLIRKTWKDIPKEFYSNVQCLTSLLDAFIKCDDFRSAESLFNTLPIKEASCFVVMMHGYLKQDKPEETMKLFHQMKKQGIEIDRNIYLNFIHAFSKISHYSLSQSLVEQIPKDLLLNGQIQAALVDMWGKTGYIEKAKEIFAKISRSNADVYVSMINAYAWNGKGSQALELYHRVPSDLINEITHVCIINACSHSGLVDQARSIFSSIETKTEKIITTMVDCLCRAAHFDEAQAVIEEFERKNSPSLVMYMTLLSGARNNNNSHLAEQTHRRMKKLFPQSNDVLAAGSTLLANVYTSVGEVEKADDIRREMYQSGLKKKIGISWTVIDGEVHKFRAHDQSHPRSAEIYAELKKMSNELIQHGHQYDSSWITRPLDADETVASVLCGHSERLAIAWNFVANPNTSQIQVTKNLRVCGDCHKATKLIAAIRQCDIIVRDASRIHHFFKNGQCSCNDYF